MGLAAHLVRLGVDASELFRSIYQRRPAEHPRDVGRLLSGVRYEWDGRLALLSLPLGPDGSPSPIETDDALDLVRSVERVEVVLLVRQTAEGTCKLSARSKTRFDVHALAQRFGGGGHVRASGATLEGSPDEVCRRLTEAVLELGGASSGEASSGGAAG